MELSSVFLPKDFPWLEVCVATVCVLLLSSVAQTFILQDEEAPIEYKVPLPEQAKPGWTGKVLEEPSIKVHPVVSLPLSRYLRI